MSGVWIGILRGGMQAICLLALAGLEWLLHKRFDQ